jgi:hypothetical protein
MIFPRSRAAPPAEGAMPPRKPSRDAIASLFVF